MKLELSTIQKKILRVLYDGGKLLVRDPVGHVEAALFLADGNWHCAPNMNSVHGLVKRDLLTQKEAADGWAPLVLSQNFHLILAQVGGNINRLCETVRNRDDLYGLMAACLRAAVDAWDSDQAEKFPTIIGDCRRVLEMVDVEAL